MKESIEHQASSIKKGNENVNTINIKNSINLGDLVKKIKAQSKPRKKGGAKSGAGGDQMIEQIQGAPGMPGQAGAPGMPGIDMTPNQPFFPAPSSSSSVMPSYVSNTTMPQNFPVSNSVVPSYMSNATVPQQSIASTLENDLSSYERARKLAEDFGVPIPESLRTISSASSAQPNNPAQLKAVDNELKNEAQEILDRLPNVPIERSGSSQSISAGTLDQLYPMFSNSLPIKPTPPDIFSSSTGERSLDNISSNSTQSKVSGLMPPQPFYSAVEYVSAEMQSKDKVLRLEQNKLEKTKNNALKENPRDIEKIRNIDNQLKDIRKQRENINPNLNPRDDNSTQSGLQLARSDSNTSVASSVLPPRPPAKKAIRPPPSINNFFEDVLALKNAPVKTQQQIARDLLREPLNIQDVPLTTTERKELRVRPPRVKKDYYTPPETRPILEDVRKFRQDVERSRNIPPQTSLLDQITSQPKPKPQERNLLGQAFGAFSNLLSSSRDARDAAGYGALALGAVQPELLPAIGAAETANQALNIIEAPVNAIERTIQARINNPAPVRKRKDAYGGF